MKKRTVFSVRPQNGILNLSVVRQLRVENGLTQTDLGQMVNVSRQTIYAVESGRFDPSIWLAFDIAQLFDMKIEDVFDFTDRIRK